MKSFGIEMSDKIGFEIFQILRTKSKMAPLPLQPYDAYHANKKITLIPTNLILLSLMVVLGSR